MSDIMSGQISDWLSDWLLIKKNFGFYQSSYQGFCKRSHQSAKDLIHITYFNYDQKDYYATWCPKLRKSFNNFSSNNLSLNILNLLV